MKNSLLLTSLILLTVTLKAQQVLPYQTGFDNATEQAGWQEYRTGFASTYDWGIITFGAISPLYCLYHDYPVGSASTDTTTDWYVSPALSFNGASSIDLKFIEYSITGTTTSVDEFGIWYSSTGADPATNTYVQVADLKSYASSTNNLIYATALPIASLGGTGYIAIKYQTNNDWLVITLDDINIKSLVGVGINAPENNLHSVTSMLLSGGESVVNPFNEQAVTLLLTDVSGRLIQTYESVTPHGLLEIPELAQGMYFLNEENKTGRKVSRIVIQ